MYKAFGIWNDNRQCEQILDRYFIMQHLDAMRLKILSLGNKDPETEKVVTHFVNTTLLRYIWIAASVNSADKWLKYFKINDQMDVHFYFRTNFILFSPIYFRSVIIKM